MTTTINPKFLIIEETDSKAVSEIKRFLLRDKSIKNISIEELFTEILIERNDVGFAAETLLHDIGMLMVELDEDQPVTNEKVTSIMSACIVLKSKLYQKDISEIIDEIHTANESVRKTPVTSETLQ